FHLVMYPGASHASPRCIAMTRSAKALVLIAALPCITRARSRPAGSVDVRGVVTWLPDGVEVGGHKTPWKELRSLEDVAPDRPALESEYATRAAKRADTAADHVQLGAWAREHELETEANKEFEAALALEPEHAAARKALGFARVGKEWRRTAEV